MSRIFATIIAVTLCTPSIAAAGAYLGIGIGGTRTESKLGELGLVPVCPPPSNPSAPPAGCDFDTLPTSEGGAGIGNGTDFAGSDVSYSFVAGWMFNQNWGLEIGYIDFGQATDDLGLPDACDTFGCSSRQWTSEIKRDGFQLFLIGSLPLNESVDLYGKAGVINWDADYQGYERSALYGNPPDYPDDPGNPNPLPRQNQRMSSNDDGTDMAAGFGINLRTDSPFSLRADFTYYDFDDTDSSYVLQLMALYNFE